MVPIREGDGGLMSGSAPRPGRTCVVFIGVTREVAAGFLSLSGIAVLAIYLHDQNLPLCITQREGPR